MKKKKTNLSKFRIFFLFLCCIGLFIMLAVSYVKGSYKIHEKEKEEQELIKTLASLREEEEKLDGEISRLQDPEYLARYAREKYFYSKDNELIIRIPEEE
ncbi:MAG: septum formation initiator family protein [Bacilli bacterium]|nr:septum formation initiator family protein [Bacilli bacterium]